jgi:hypothetical protein
LVKSSIENFGTKWIFRVCLAILPGIFFAQRVGVLRAEEPTMTESSKANIFNDVVQKMFSGQKVTPAEFGEFIKAQNDGATSGLKVGEKIPDFALPDQHGNRQGFRDLAGSDGLLLVFSRSADW